MRKLVSVLVVAALAAVTACQSSSTSQSSRQITILTPDAVAALDTEAPGMLVLESMTAIVNLMEGLVDFAPAGTTSQDGIKQLDFTKFEGRLAESWTFNPSTLTYTFHLRHGVVGCTGNGFSADDVMYTFARAKSVTGALGPLGWFMFNTGGVSGFTPDVLPPKSQTTLGDEVTKVDDYTVNIKVSSQRRLFFPVLTDFFTYIWDSKAMKAHATSDDPWSHKWATDNNAPGFGPYCLEKWTKGSDFVARANPHYYRGKPYFDRVDFRKVPEDANRIAALQSGAAQVIQALTPKEFDFLRHAGKGVKVNGIVGNQYLFFGMPWTIKPFDNPVLRQALAYALPYEQILSVGYIGQAKKWEGTVPSSYVGFYKTPTQYSTDLGKAAQLLAQAGYPGGKGLDPSLLQLSYVGEREGTLGPIATLIQASFKNLGLNLQLNPMPQAQFADRVFAKHDVPMFLDDQDKPDLVTGEYALGPFMTTTGPGNYTKYSNPQIDALVAQIYDETDAAKQQQLLNQAQEILMEAPNWVPIAEYETQWGLRDNVTGITWHPEDQLRWFDLKLTG
jgi:peptide/nickel transport system substrate-binding protein